MASKPGPYQPAQIAQMLADGKITFDTPAWHQGLSEWSVLSKVVASFPPVPGMLPIPQPASKKKGMSSWVVALIVIGVLMLFVLPCLAGLALGPIKHGLEAAREVANTESERAIFLMLKDYADEHNGNYPDGATSTEVFQKLIDEKYASDPSIFYFPMKGKTKPTSNHLTAENVCYDVTSGIGRDSSNFVPVIFSVGYNVTYVAGASITPDPIVKPPYSGVAVLYKNNIAHFIRASTDGTIPHFIPAGFDSGTKTYKQLKP